jgi:5-methylcytosine-specific restriction endonuclease McrA
VTTKICTKCGQEKGLDEFQKDKNGKNGYRAQCRICRRETRIKWDQQNAEHVKDYHKKYNARRWENDRDYMSEKNRRWSRENKLRRNEARRRRQAKILGSTVEKVDYSAILKRDNSICHICGKKVRKNELSFDHLIPIALGGPHVINNIRVAHRSCNCRRGPGRLPAQLLLDIKEKHE